MGVAFVAHCLLNQNSKVGDGAHCAGVYSPVIGALRDKGWRIEQMPCPELAFTGLNRFWAVKEQLDTAAYRRHCARLAEAVAAAISVRVGQGEDVVLVGVEGSPSMGVTITSSDPLRGGRPEWPDGTAEHTSGEGHLRRGDPRGARPARDQLPPGRGRDPRAGGPRRSHAARRDRVRAGQRPRPQ